MKTLILIPSSRYVSDELKFDVGEIPPVLIPVQGRLLIEHIKESFDAYPGEKIFLITVCQGAEKVREQVSRLNCDNIKIVNVSGEKDLGGTMHEVFQNLNLQEYDKLIINFGDTLIQHPPLEKEYILYKDIEETFRWTTFQMLNNKITKIVDKKQSDSFGVSHVIVGFFSLNNPILFASKLSKSMSINGGLDSFYLALREYLAQVDYQVIPVHTWYDFGHLDNYFETKKLFLNKRFFNEIHVSEKRAVVEKRSKNADKFIGEIQWYKKLPPALKFLVPQIFEYSCEKDAPFLQMEYYGYPSLSDIYLFGGHKLDVWNKIFNTVFSCIEELKMYRISETSETINSALEEMYIKKTCDRLNVMRNEPAFFDLWKNPVFINGVEYKSLDTYIQMLSTLFDTLFRNSISEMSIIHGDFCISNILFDLRSGIIKLIDPRGKFGSFKLYGDYRYDLAKLSHSFNGKYEAIINDMFSLTKNGNLITYKYNLSAYHQQITDMFNKTLEKHYYPEDVLAIRCIEALLFLSMIPLHSDSKNRQILMLATGIEKLHAVLLDPKMNFDLKLLLKTSGHNTSDFSPLVFNSKNSLGREFLLSQGKNMNVIITMAGEGTRFKNIGFTVPKHEIVVRGKTLFEWSMLSLKNFFDKRFIFIARESHNPGKFIAEECAKIGITNYEIVPINILTDGQATTALFAEQYIQNKDDEIIIYNIDTYVEPEQIHPRMIRGDGWVPAFEAEGTRWSFVRFDEGKRVTHIVEKERISSYGTIGLYYFKSWKLYTHCHATFPFPAGKEKYIAPLYNVLLDEKREIYTDIIHPTTVHILGTPEDIQQFAPEFLQDQNAVFQK